MKQDRTPEHTTYPVDNIMKRLLDTLPTRRLYKLLTIIAMIAVCASAYAQTCRVKCKSQHGNHVTYREVYEYDYVSVKPTFPGGNTQLISFMNRTRQYPEEAYNHGIHGRVIVSFVVNTDGRISDIKVLRSVEESLDREAVRIIENMPNWQPGKHHGKCVPVRVIQTVPFRI